MGLSHHNRNERESKFSSIRHGLELLHENHFNKHCDVKTEKYTAEWFGYCGIWDDIYYNIFCQQQGEISGCLEVFETLRFIEFLAQHDEEQFQLASLLLCRALHEDFFRGNGLRDVFEHFMLVRYGIAADMGMKTEWRGNMTRIAVRMPGLWYRIITHYPSPRRIIHDWQKLTAGLWSLDFRVDLKGSNLFVSVAVPPEPITDDMDPDFMATANYLVNIVRAGL